MRDVHEEEPFEFEDLGYRQEWDNIVEEALAEGYDEVTARELANDEMYQRSVGDEAYYGVSRGD
jgi:hypothetical protein